ncbi:MAG: adenosylmethionine--8-amino-7-oxononanoate transaminase [Defluviicoccus sp.]|nr:adenosylmethionine--8-amino-7-oxononanoate transaminase [Defluviicoccus sp.]
MAETPGNLWFPYTPMRGMPPPLEAVGTEGARIRLADGRELVDGIASWWTACHGYNHPHILDAMEAQLRRMPHVMFGGMVHEPAVRLARRLAALLGSGLDHVFFSDSGSVSVEIALKMAIQYWRNRGIEGRGRFVCFRGAYHGDTLGTMAVCDPEDGMHRLLGGYVPPQIVLDLPLGRRAAAAFEDAMARHAGEIAAVVVEPLLQAAGGMRFHPPETLAAIARVCRRHDLLLVLDEVATGFGRTGTMFAFEQAGVAPDMVCLSKALTGGTMGLAATVANRIVFSAFDSEDPKRALMHGPTFMANPLGCAAANASLDLFEREPRLEQARRIESRLRESLEPCRSMPRVVDVRVLGAVGVVELDRIDDLAGMRMRFVEEGVWIRPLGDAVYLMPALTISPDELDLLTGAIRRVVGALS